MANGAVEGRGPTVGNNVGTGDNDDGGDCIGVAVKG